jgi:hypothetical protein
MSPLQPVVSDISFPYRFIALIRRGQELSGSIPIPAVCYISLPALSKHLPYLL